MYSVIIAVIVTLTNYWYTSTKHRRDLANRHQGPKCWPIIGYPKLFTLTFDELLDLMNELTKNYKNYFKIWLGPALRFVVYDPVIIEKILTDQKVKKADDYKFFRPWIGTGLLTNEGKSWFAKRKAITPAFHFNILEDFIEVVTRQSDVFIKKIKEQNIVDIDPHLLLLTFDITCETSMGSQMNAQTDTNSNYLQANENLARIAYKRMFNVFYSIELFFRLTEDYKIFKESIKIIRLKNREIIAKRRKQLENSKDNGFKIRDEFGRRRKMALLDSLLQITIDDKPLSDDEIEDEVNTFMFAGQNTTGAALGFLLHSIAKYPEIQRKICEETFKIFGNDRGGEITINKLNELKYLELVIKESMRMYTTAPFIGRQVMDECEIANIKFPANTSVYLYIYGMCHREDLFPNPEKFIPERFDPDNNLEKKNPFAYIPFSAGHRNCLGQKFAMLVMKTVVTKILQNFEIFLKDPNENLILIPGVNLKSKNGISLKFKIKN